MSCVQESVSIWSGLCRVKEIGVTGLKHIGHCQMFGRKPAAKPTTTGFKRDLIGQGPDS